MARPPLLVLAGATASGKTAVALELAAALNGEIVSADSRTVYRGFDVGTAKPTPAERAHRPHHLIDVADPTETYTVARFKADAARVVAELHARARLPLLVGGTGFYIRGLTGGLVIPAVPPQPELRERLEALADPHARLVEVDPVTAARLHPHDRVRIVRALEVHAVLGKPLSEAATHEPSPYDVLYLVLDWPREELYRRIDRRVHQMIAQGLEDEVARLAVRFGPELPLLQTLGYAEILAYQQGRSTRDQAIAAIQQNTRRYARRQLTWFRGQPEAVWIDATRSEQALREIRRRVAEKWGESC